MPRLYNLTPPPVRPLRSPRRERSPLAAHGRADRARAVDRLPAPRRGAHGARPRQPAALHRWSVDEPAAFWEPCGRSASSRRRPAASRPRRRPHAGHALVPGARLNFAENLLRRAASGPALVFRGEDGAQRRADSDELARAEAACAARAARARRAAGRSRRGLAAQRARDAIAAMLASAAVGAIWSSCSPDFGARGVLDRFGQIEPDGAVRGGRLLLRRHARTTCCRALERGARRAAEPARAHVVVPWRRAPTRALARGVRRWDDALAPHAARRARVRAAAVRPPALHPLLARHHRRAEVHRARRRRHAAAAPEGAAAARRPARAATACSTSRPAAG